jgi:hypothetical protein
MRRAAVALSPRRRGTGALRGAAPRSTQRRGRLTAGAALLVLLACAPAHGPATRAAPAATRSPRDVEPQCLKAEGATFPNLRPGWRTAAYRAHTYPLARALRVRASGGRRATLVIWEAMKRGRAFRAYLWWEGRRGGDLHTRAARVVDRLAAHPHRAHRSFAMISGLPLAATRHFDRFCHTG